LLAIALTSILLPGCWCLISAEEITKLIETNPAELISRLDEASELNVQEILTKAVELGQSTLLDALIERVENLEFAITTSLNTKGTLIHQAVLNGDVASVEKLIKAGAKLNAVDSRGNSPVHAVMEAWNYFTIFSHSRPKYFKNEIDLLGTLQTLINNKAKVEGLNNEQKSPLQLACEYRFAPAAELLLKHGADLNRANIHGFTPLLISMDTSSFIIQFSKVLTRHGNVFHYTWLNATEEKINALQILDIDLPGNLMMSNGTSYNRSVLNEVIWAYNQQLVDVLLTYKPNLRVKDSQQNNALHIAAFNGNYLALKSLLENGFNHFKSRNKDGLTPLQAAAISNYIKAQNVLIEHGANAESLKTLSFYGNHADEGDTIDGVSGKVPLRVHRTKFNATEHSAILEGNGDEGTTISAEITGGWRYEAEPEIDIDFCEIDKRESLTAKEFYEEYFRMRKPVIIKGAVQWDAFKRWTRPQLESKYGNVEFMVYSRKKYGPPISNKMLLKDYFAYMDQNAGKDKEPVWLVDIDIDPRAQQMAKMDVSDIEILKNLFDGTPYRFANYQFMIAPAYAGASQHFHNSAANVLVYGRKRWFLYPPAQAIYSVKHIHEWYTQDYPNLPQDQKPLECIQEPGDLIYVPNMWGHGVIYTKDSIGMAYLYTG
jgi:ankyrin repeat protein